MKTVVSALLIVIFFGLKKDSAKVPDESLIGTWELNYVLGGQVAGAPSDFPKGNGIVMVFSENENRMPVFPSIGRFKWKRDTIFVR